METTIETVEPGVDLAAGVGRLADHLPFGGVAFFFADRGFEAAAADPFDRDVALGADQDRHLDQLRAAGDD